MSACVANSSIFIERMIFSLGWHDMKEFSCFCRAITMLGMYCLVWSLSASRFTTASSKYLEKIIYLSQRKFTINYHLKESLGLCKFSPDFQVRLWVEICRQLLDEWEQHGLMQGTVGLAEQFLWVDLLAQLDDQLQVRGGQRLLEGFVQLALVHEVEYGGELCLWVDAWLRSLRSRVQVWGMFAQRPAYRFGHRLAGWANDVFLQTGKKRVDQ